ncbi:MAG: energy transducer TonB [Balneolaceae bacterium]
MVVRKKPEANLRSYYHIFLELGLLITLIVLNIAARIDIRISEHEMYVLDEQEIVEMEEIIQTQQQEMLPPPPKPRIPVEVPNDEVIEDVEINLDAELNLEESLELPPPPAESEEEEEEEIFVVVEQMPELIGGLAELQSKIRYPEMARRAGIEGRVYVQFIVNEQGNVEDPRVIRGIGGGADEEALRAVREAKFRPGMQRGRPVRVQYSLPIFFRLQN